jgi:hypothetical protein
MRRRARGETRGEAAILNWFRRLFFPDPPMTYAQIVDRYENGMTDEEWNLRGSEVARRWGVDVELYALAARDCALRRRVKMLAAKEHD